MSFGIREDAYRSNNSGDFIVQSFSQLRSRRITHKYATVYRVGGVDLIFYEMKLHFFGSRYRILVTRTYLSLGRNRISRLLQGYRTLDLLTVEGLIVFRTTWLSRIAARRKPAGKSYLFEIGV